VGRKPSRRLLNVLRTTVDQLERNTDLAPGDPALVQLKGILLRRIADLEVAAAPVSDLETDLLSVVDAPAVSEEARDSLPAEVMHEAGTPEA